MSPSRWERVTELFHELVEKPPAEQERRLAELSAGEPELGVEVRSLLLADRRSDQIPDRAGPLPVEDLLAPGTAIGPYRVIAELARGGMGVVYRAERADGAFERQVAIKLTRPDLQSPALGDRFLAERRILAALDHPGIARLLDAGTTAEGRLFLVLDLVDGEPLDRWAAGRSLTARLELFLAICDAVEHAHRQLVLHRDLKPANILVTAAGEPKLLDFGIARLLGEDSAPGTATRLGLRPMTPEYASPEQLRGDPLATASDVYSLGIILFELLTSERPYAQRDSTSPEERARRIDTDPLPRPSSVLRRAPRPALFPPRIVEGDLDAVVGRALAPELARRYASVAELAADLRRFLDGRPVEARNPGRIERARKFVRRHRNAVAAAGTVALVLIAATVFSLRQAAIAARERDRAERRFADVRELARVFVFELPERIENLAGSTAARALLVKTGLSYLDRLYAEFGGDTGLTRELAAGYERLAEVQAGLNAANVGETAAALATLDRALELRQRLRAEAAGDGVSEATELAAAHLARATALFKNGRRAEALAEAQKTADLLAADSAPSGDPGRERLFAKTLSLRGFLEATSGDLTAAEASLRSAVQHFDRLVARPPVAAAVRGERARALERLGSILGQNPGNYPEVERLWGETLAVDRALLAEAPRQPARTRAVMADLGRLAILRGMEGNLDAALLLSGEALVLAERLAAEDPDDFEAQRSLAQLRNRRSVDLTETGRLDEAERTARQGLASISALFAADPSNVTVETLVAEGHEAVGQVLVARARAASDRAVWQAARGELAAAVEIIERLIARGVLAKDLGEAQEAEVMRAWISECDRFLAGSNGARNP